MEKKETLEDIVKRANSYDDNAESAFDFLTYLLSGENEEFNKAFNKLMEEQFSPSKDEENENKYPLESVIDDISDYVARGLKLFANGAKADRIVIYNASELETGDGPVADLFSEEKSFRLSYIRLREMVEAHEDVSGEASFCYYAAEIDWRGLCNHCEDTASALEKVCKKVSNAFGGVPCYLNGTEGKASEI